MRWPRSARRSTTCCARPSPRSANRVVRSPKSEVGRAKVQGGAGVATSEVGHRTSKETVLATMRPGHPRLLLLPSDVERIRLAVATDPTARSYRDKLVRDGERILNEAPVERVLVGPRLLAASRRALDRVYTLVLLYRLDGEAKWAARATAEMHAAAAFSDWNPSHFLDVAEMSHALAVGYDWLFDVLSDGDRAAIKQALVEKGLRPAEQ